MLRLIVAFLSMALAAEFASAADAPKFLKGKKYSTDPAECSVAEPAESEALVLSEQGVFGYEFGCVFVGFFEEKSADNSSVSHIAVASCGDDSGITRPDLITLILQPDKRTLTVQSQNEYVVAEAVRLAKKDQQGDDDNLSFVSKDYTLCK